MLGFCHSVSLEVALDDPHFASQPLQRPCAVFHFPIVRAESAEGAAELVRTEVAALVDALALLRGSSGELIGGVVVDLEGGPGLVWTHGSQYRGNLIGGFLAGEDPRLIRHYAMRVRSDSQVALYLSLLRDAQAEIRQPFAAFRYWGILETMARAKDYVGQPLLNWQGEPVVNKSGVPRAIPDEAKPLVLELIRRRLARQWSERPAGEEPALPRYEEMIGVWYQRRNCVAHRGGCFRDDPKVCIEGSPSHVRCATAHDECVTKSSDAYHDALRRTVVLLVQAECA
jgi:hypothetical protein